MNQVIKSMLLLTISAVPIWVLFRILRHVLQQNPKEQFSVKREILLAIFFTYLVLILTITIIPMPLAGFKKPNFQYINIIPLFHSLECIWGNAKGARFCLQNIIGNIAIFIPFGFLMPLIWDKYRSLKNVFISAFIFSFSIELIQFFEHYFGTFRIVDIDDIILNIAGACLGFCLIYITEKRGFFRKPSFHTNF